MKKIIAKLEDGSFRTVFNSDNKGFTSIESSYHTPTFTDEIIFKFDPEKKLENDEWFYVEPSEEQMIKMIDPYISTITNIDSLNPITKNDYQNIRAICLIEKEVVNDNGLENCQERLIISRVYPRFYTIARKILKWNDGPQFEEQSSSVYFSGYIDAYWIAGKLYFKSYLNIKPIFDGLEDFYRLATEDEKNEFLQKDFFKCEDTNIVIKQRNLRKIASVINNINWSEPLTRQKYIKYAEKYPNIGVQITADGKLKIESNQDVTKILSVLEERIYTTPITGEEREAHSISKLNQ